MDPMPSWHGDAARPGVIPLRPLALGEVYSGAVQTIRQHPGITLGTAAVLATIQQTLSALLTPTVDAVTIDPNKPMATLAQSLSIWSFLLPVIGLVLTQLLTGLVTVVVGKAVIGRPAPAETVWRELRPQLWPLIGLILAILLIGIVVGIPAGLVIGAGIAVGGKIGVLLIALGALGGLVVVFWVGVQLALAPPALILEHCSIKQALRRSRQLVRGAWWSIFGVILLTAVIFLVASMFVGILFGATGSVVVMGIGSILLSTFYEPFQTAVVALLYVDRRIRTENFATVLEHSAQTPGQDL